MGVLLGAIEEVQAGWAIPDLVLRANLRDALAEDFLSLYEGMLQRNAASASRVTDKNIRYQVPPGRESPSGKQLQRIHVLLLVGLDQSAK